MNQHTENPTNNPLDTLKTLLQNRLWRLNHLYWIHNKEGKLIRFKLNQEQLHIHQNLHTRNDILKARQLGISTYVSILILDLCLFSKNKECGIIDKTLDDAKGKLAKIRTAYNKLDHLPDNPTTEDIALAKLGAQIKREIKPTSNAETTISYNTGGKIKIGVSLRGGTLQLLHVSELGHVAAHHPKRAREIISGGINTVPKECVVIKESTHEGGKWGQNYELTVAAMNNIGKTLNQLDYKFFFFSWHNRPEYTIEDITEYKNDNPELEKYFTQLEETHGISLSPGQKTWYASNYNTLGYMIRQEYPSTPEEAFCTQVEGAIYGSQIDALRSQGRLNAEFEIDPIAPLYTSWDIGMSDYMSIWLWQVNPNGTYSVIDSYQCNNQPLEHYINKCRAWEGHYQAQISKHLLPHDAAKRDWEGTSFHSKLLQAGFNASIVPRTPDIWAGIQAVRRHLRYCIFHSRCSQPQKIDGIEYMSGLNALENYQKAPNGANGTEKDSPLHNRCSHAADAFRTFPEAIEAGLISKNAPNTTPQHYPRQNKLARGAEIFNLR